MPQHSYKQLEEAYQKGVNKEHKPNPARTRNTNQTQQEHTPCHLDKGRDAQRCQ